MTARTSPALLAASPLALALILALVLGAPARPRQRRSADVGLGAARAAAPPTGVSGSSTPIALGRIGDIEFWAPNRGLLITAGNPPTIPAGVWAYNGEAWHELANVCGASDGRIAWAGPDEFWTSPTDARGRRSNPPKIQNYRRWKTTRSVTSPAVRSSAPTPTPAFQADSYQAMHAAGCFDPDDCWFAGDPLEEPQIGAFQLHWNGSSLAAEPYAGEGHAAESMSLLEGVLYEGVRIAAGDRETTPDPEPPVVHRINPIGILPSFEPETEVPLYGAEERPEALDALQLSAGRRDAVGRRRPQPAEGGMPGQVTVVRRVEGFWSQLLGPEHPLGAIFPNPSEEEQLLGRKARLALLDRRRRVRHGDRRRTVREAAWVALAPPEGASVSQSQARAVLVHVSAEGQVLGEQTLPSNAEQAQGVGPKGAATKLTCPAANDCWLATAQGWLYQLAPGGRTRSPRGTKTPTSRA